MSKSVRSGYRDAAPGCACLVWDARLNLYFLLSLPADRDLVLSPPRLVKRGPTLQTTNNQNLPIELDRITKN